ncbi:MAG: tRNA preQ1(34) S-adenosylmethionine ribosyltransferase-isomerase QueA, partial [Phycisphaerae bacterium]
AQRPAQPRDDARLMIVRRSDQSIEDAVVRDLPAYLRAGDCLVRNRTRVVPARFVARRRTGGRVSALFLREVRTGTWEVLLTGRGRLREGDVLTLTDGAGELALRERGERGMWLASVTPPESAERILNRIGSTPLPPYIRRAEGGGDAERLDRERYQTIYATEPGAVAAPTAGLHFTTALTRSLEAAGVGFCDVTLHVGLGTFQPIEADDLSDHRMHAEWFRLPAGAALALQRVRQRGGRIVAVGTTSVRVLDTRAGDDGAFRAGEGWTDLLIQPPYRFRATDALLTNFHLPRSTLLALVCAFAGRRLVLEAYRAAVGRGYRFYSYGDAMLIL